MKRQDFLTDGNLKRLEHALTKLRDETEQARQHLDRVSGLAMVCEQFLDATLYGAYSAKENGEKK